MLTAYSNLKTLSLDSEKSVFNSYQKKSQFYLCVYNDNMPSSQKLTDRQGQNVMPPTIATGAKKYACIERLRILLYRVSPLSLNFTEAFNEVIWHMNKWMD